MLTAALIERLDSACVYAGQCVWCGCEGTGVCLGVECRLENGMFELVQ
jgi:hypothetical protein